MKTTLETLASGPMENRIARVGSDLARTFGALLGAIPGAPHRPQGLARSLGLNVVLTSRLLKAAQQRDPLTVAHMIPGPEPLRRFLRAVEKKKVDPALVHDARDAVDRFQQLIDVDAGDRSALDAIISGWLPDAREKVELIAKQSVYRGVSQLLGTACDVEHCAYIIHPAGAAGANARRPAAPPDDSPRSQNSASHTPLPGAASPRTPHSKLQTPNSLPSPARADVVTLLASQGVRRVRPGLVVKYDTVHAAPPLLTLTGQPVESMQGLLLEQFCSKPLPQMEVTHTGQNAQFTLCGDGVGVESAVDLVHATLTPAHKDLHRLPGEPPRKITLAVGIAIPSKSFVFDVLLHDDVYPAQDPTLAIYRTAGVFNAGPGRLDVDRLDIIESVRPLGRGLARMRSTDTPSFQEMVQFVCDQRQWDPATLRAYRCRIDYPMYSSELVMSFDLPAHSPPPHSPPPHSPPAP